MCLRWWGDGAGEGLEWCGSFKAPSDVMRCKLICKFIINKPTTLFFLNNWIDMIPEKKNKRLLVLVIFVGDRCTRKDRKVVIKVCLLESFD